MDKTKICLINDSFPPAIDGVANAVVNYGTYITKNHGEAVVVTPFYPDSDDSVFPFPVVRYPSIDVTKSVGYRAGMPFDAAVLQRLDGEGYAHGNDGRPGAKQDGDERAAYGMARSAARKRDVEHHG